jgi:hypothetical protein
MADTAALYAGFTFMLARFVPGEFSQLELIARDSSAVEHQRR